MSGLLFAEEQHKLGWKVSQIDYTEEWCSWTFKDSEATQTVFGEAEWLNGVRDYYKNLREVSMTEEKIKTIVYNGVRELEI